MTTWLRPPRPWQREALQATVKAWKAGQSPLIHACTGAGKSLLLAEICGRAKGRVLVTTPTQALVSQLAATISERCGAASVGRAYQHDWTTKRRIVVACHASVGAVLDECAVWDGWLADEAHRLEGDTLRDLYQRIQAAHSMGLTATPYRSDGRGLRVWDDLVYSYTSHDAVSDGALTPWRVVRWDGEGDDDTDRICADWIASARGRGVVSAVSIADAEEFADRIGSVAVHSRMANSEVVRRLTLLRAGALKCVVHVNMLSEGVDLPWLEWLVLRRKVASPVRLVQEVGRVLRAHPGKSEATIYDPHDALGAVGLVHAAALEDALARAKADVVDTWEIPQLDGVEYEGATIPRAVAVDALSGEITDYLGELRAAGLAEPPRYGEGPWRQKRATKAQRAALKNMAWLGKRLPDRPRELLEWLVTQSDIRSGTASDMIVILAAQRR